jgi:uncharacterized protein YceK
MKKHMILLAVALTLALSGCAAQITTTTPSGTISEAAESTQPAEKEESAAAVSAEPTDSAIPEETATDKADEPANPTAATQTSDKPVGTNPTAKPANPPKTEAPPAAATPKPTEPPKTEAPTPSPTPTPAPTEPEKTKTAYDAPYDTARMIADAKAYGESIGMTWSAPLTVDNCSWEAPIHTSSVLSGERLKAAIESGIRRVKKLQTDNEYQPGEFHFKVLFEASGDSKYTVYFLIG